MNKVREAVSRNKRRYRKNGFDLDLSYITPRLVAMGFPSEKVEGVYRNPFKEVFRFLELEHKDHYKVYNLCSERSYDISKFHNRVEKFPFDDHNAPPLDLVFKFCQNVKEWLDASEKNVAIIHCKAGKGRTGLMICSYLVWSREWKTSQEALDFYAAMRTYNKKGVTIPSQIRYVHYVGKVVNEDNGVPPEARALLLKNIIFHTLPKLQLSDLRFSVYVVTRQDKTLVFNFTDSPVVKGHKKKKKANKEESSEEPEEETLHFETERGVPLFGDVKIDFFEKKDNRVMSFWFHTGFVSKETNVLELAKEELDKAAKDKNKIYSPDFKIELVFQPIDDNTPSTPSAQLANLTLKAPKLSIIANTTPLEGGILNSVGKCQTTSRSPNEVVEDLLTKAIQIYILYSQSDDSEIIESLKDTKNFKEFAVATSELQKVDLSSCKPEEKLTFWINAYNLLALHANILSLPPPSFEARVEFSSNMRYDIGGHLYSLVDIEFSVLRAKMIIPEAIAKCSPLVKKFDADDARHNFALTSPEPRINFALNPGATSAPLLRIFHHDKIFEELEQATRVFLQDGVDVDPETKEIWLPKMLEWYYRDFAKTPEKMVATLGVYLSAEQKVEDLSTYKINYEGYDWAFHYSFKHFNISEVDSSLQNAV